METFEDENVHEFHGFAKISKSVNCENQEAWLFIWCGPMYNRWEGTSREFLSHWQLQSVRASVDHPLNSYARSLYPINSYCYVFSVLFLVVMLLDMPFLTIS